VRVAIRWLRNVALTIAGLIILLAAAGATYQAIATRLDAQRFPEAGRLVDAGGFRLNINCTGQGSPTVILESGLGDLSNVWRRVQPELAKDKRVCSYDRAGYGSSDPGSFPRSSWQIAGELNTLLRNAGEHPPYIMVGHSFGGYNVRVYHGRYPDQVLGMVLVDSTQEDQYTLLPSAWNEISAAVLKRYQNQALMAPLFIGLGIGRLMLRARGHDQGSYLILQSKYLQARASELEAIQISARQARDSGNLAAKPLVVLTAGKNSDQTLQSGLTPQDFAEWQRVWVEELQPRLARLSTNGERIVLPDSGHDIPAERPDVIVSAVRQVIGQPPAAR
jgi:pimeloyl-ACP methyl ester carboxylesterase